MFNHTEQAVFTNDDNTGTTVATATITSPAAAPATLVSPVSVTNELDDELRSMGQDLEQLVDQRAVGLRRIADVCCAVFALLVLTPIFLVVAAAIRFDSRGSVFYTQDRVGQNRRRRQRRAGSRSCEDRRQLASAGNPFTIWKFRTMTQNAEANGPQWASAQDPRVTRVGKVLRTTRLDEVPQFINVLRGDMALIGPRPERSFFVNMLESEIPSYSKRLLVKPGITGFAQVNNGYDDSIESVRRKVAWDLRYIRSQGLRADCDVLLKTVRTILTGDGAH